MNKGKYSEIFSLVQDMNQDEWGYLKRIIDTAFKEKASKISLEGNDLNKSVNLVKGTVPKFIRQQFESD